MVPSMEHLAVINRLADDPRFQTESVPISSLSRMRPDRLVRVLGKVKAWDVGHMVRIRDSSGQVDVYTGQIRPCAIDNLVEAVGYPVANGTQWQLMQGVFRDSKAAPEGTGELLADKTLRLAAQVLELPAEEAAKGRPVSLTGVVTWSYANAPFFFVEDSSGGVCVMSGGTDAVRNYPGRNVHVNGTTAVGSFAPLVNATQLSKVSDIVLPTADLISLEVALTGAEEAHWVEMEGYLRRIRAQDGWNYMEVVNPTGEFAAVLPPDQDLSSMVGGFVRVQGVCAAVTNSERKLTGIKLWVPSALYVRAETMPPKDPFDLPAQSLAGLGLYNSAQSFNRLQRFSGTVLHSTPGQSVQIEEGGQSLLVFAQSRVPLEPGDRIEAVGILARQGARVTLREAVYRKTGHGPQPNAVRIELNQAPSFRYDGHLVNIEGTLINYSTTGDQFRLSLQNDKALFEAFLSKNATGGAYPDAAEGSRLSLTGVYELIFDNFGKPSAYRINLRTAGDISVLQRPSWLTRGRILAVAGALMVGVLLFIAWVAVLRRQVREQVKRESRLEAELQRASKLESLGLLAGGIAHDFNNLLTAVIGNLSLARLDATVDTESTMESLRAAEKAAARAKDLTQQLLTFAKGGSPIQAAVLLPDIVREVAEFALSGSKVRCRFDIANDLWPANVDRGQIGQVVQNIVINAMQAMPEGGVIDISIQNSLVGAELGRVLVPGRYVLLVFTDHGEGILPENIERVFDPYFTTKKGGNGLGLATVHSIVKKHLGHISAESEPGKGTTFRVWLPAAEGVPTSGQPKLESAAGREGGAAARILFMDDEQPIRQLGCSILGRAGYEVTAVSDGTEAVNEYAAGLRDGRPFSVVILDLTIPGGMGGRQTIEQLRKLDPAVRAIVSSGYSNDSILSNYKAHGFMGMVSKPYENVDLTVAVEAVLKGGTA